MRLRVLLPTQVLVDAEVSKIVAEAANGSFALLERHIDFAAPLVPGLLAFVEEGEERFVALDYGILVKQGKQVLVSAQRAAAAGDLGELREVLEKEFLRVEEREQRTRSALARLESGIVRRFMQLGRREHD